MKKTILKLSTTLLIVGIVIFSFYAHAQVVTPDEFMQKAALGGIFEIQSSQLALDNSQNEDVKRFARMMIEDHTKMNDELKSKLPQTGLRDPEIPSDLDDKHQAILSKMASKYDASFDKLYVQSQLDEHQNAVALFKNYAKYGDDYTLKTFAIENLPTLKTHLSHIKALQLTGRI